MRETNTETELRAAFARETARLPIRGNFEHKVRERIRARQRDHRNRVVTLSALCAVLAIAAGVVIARADDSNTVRTQGPPSSATIQVTAQQLAAATVTELATPPSNLIPFFKLFATEGGFVLWGVRDPSTLQVTAARYSALDKQMDNVRVPDDVAATERSRARHFGGVDRDRPTRSRPREFRAGPFDGQMAPARRDAATVPELRVCLLDRQASRGDRRIVVTSGQTIRGPSLRSDREQLARYRCTARQAPRELLPAQLRSPAVDRHGSTRRRFPRRDIVIVAVIPTSSMTPRLINGAPNRHR